MVRRPKLQVSRWISSAPDVSAQTNLADLQALLINVGAIKGNDYRVQRSEPFGNEPAERNLRSGKNPNTTADGDDDDWD